MDFRPLRTMVDMEMGDLEHGSMPGMPMDHGSMLGMELSPEAKTLRGTVGVDNVAEMPTERLNRPGEGIPRGRRALGVRVWF